MQHIRHAIPVPPHILQFVKQLHGHPLHIIKSKSSKPATIPSGILNIITTNVDAAPAASNQSKSQTLYIHLPKYYYRQGCPAAKKLNITNRHIIEINKMLNHLFKETVHNHFQLQHKTLGLPVRTTANNFIQQYNMHTIITSDYIIKIYQRRQSLN